MTDNLIQPTSPTAETQCDQLHAEGNPKMSASQHCPLCSGSGFRSTDGGPAHQMCECMDLEDTPHQQGFNEGFLAGHKCGEAHAQNQNDVLRARIAELETALAGERERVAAAFACQAYWRLQGATPDRNTQTSEEILAQDEAYERRLLAYMCGELDEEIEPLTAIQAAEVRRRFDALSVLSEKQP